MTDRTSAEGLHPECAKRGYHRDGCDVQPPWRDDQGYWLGGMGTPGPRPEPIATLSLYEQGRRQTLMDLGFDIDGIDTATAVEAARDAGPRPDSGGIDALLAEADRRVTALQYDVKNARMRQGIGMGAGIYRDVFARLSTPRTETSE